MLLAGTYTVVDLFTPSKAFFPNLGGVLPSKVIEVRLVQPLKAPYSILVTELGIVTEVRLEQPSKALSPILVTEFGIVTEVRP